VQDDETSSVGGSIRKMFSAKKKPSSATKKAPAPVEEPKEEVVEAPKEVEIEEPTPEPEPAYVDDNDGKKEKGCWCC